MHRPPIARLALTAALAFAATGAQAVEYGKLDTAASTIGFRFSQMGVTLDGSFKQFSAQLRFDPARPEAASTTVEVPLAGIDTGSAEGNDEVKTKPWFNTAQHPVARFVSASVKPLGANRYEVAGELSIKGKRREVRFPATFTPGPSAARFEGTLPLNRTDFGIGEGEWSAGDIVAHKVEVVFTLVATPLAP